MSIELRLPRWLSGCGSRFCLSLESLEPYLNLPATDSFWWRPKYDTWQRNLGATYTTWLPVGLGVSLRVHVPKYYILWPKSSPSIGTLGPKYILFGYMDP